MSWGSGKGILLAVVSGILAPFLTATGIAALFIGSIFDLTALATIGMVLMTLGAILFAFLLWKLWRGYRSAKRAWQDLSGQSGNTRRNDDDRVSGRWEQR